MYDALNDNAREYEIYCTCEYFNVRNPARGYILRSVPIHRYNNICLMRVYNVYVCDWLSTIRSTLS